MKFLTKKSSADSGVSIMLISIFIMLTMIVIMMFSFNGVKISLLKVSLRDGMDIVCLSSVMPDIEAMKESSKDSVGFNPENGFGIGVGNSGTDSLYFMIDEDGSYDRFSEILECNVEEVVKSNGVSNLKIENVIFYTIEDENVTEHFFDRNGICSAKVVGKVGEVFSPNGIEVRNVSVYAKVSFEYTDVFGFKHTGLSAENYKAARLQ